MKPVFELGFWKCPLCDFRAMNRVIVERHIKEAHANELKTKGERNRREKKKVDYVRELNGKKVKLVLFNGKEIGGLMYAEDDYTIKLELDNNFVVINKAYIVMYIPLEAEK